MTINLADNTPRKSYTVSAGSSASSFDTDFEFFVDADLDVFVDGVQKTLATDYTVTGGNGSTGTVTFNSAISAGASDIIVVLTRSIDIERTTDFPSAGPFDIASLNLGLDKIVAIQADLNDSINRSLRLTAYDTDVALTLPDVDTRKGKLLAFNETTGAVEAGATVSGATTIASVAADIQTLADIQDGTTATNAITNAAAVASDISLVAAVDGDVTLVAAVDGDVTTVAGQISPTNNISTVAGLATEIGRLGTADAVADINTLGTTAAVADMATLAPKANDITTVAGKASLITADFVADLNTVAVTDVINDINTLATSDIVSDLNTLATSDIVSDLNTLATTDIVNDINTLATTDIVSDLNLLATSDFVSDLNTLATAQNVSDLNSVAGAIAAVNNVSSNLDAVENFADTYFVGSSAPSGSNVTEGDLWFDTTVGQNILKVYDGSNFIPAGSAVNGTSEREDYVVGTSEGTYTGSTTVFPAVYDVGFVDVYLNGIKLMPEDFTATNGTSITLGSAAQTSDTVSIVGYGTFDVAAVSASNLTSGTIPDARFPSALPAIDGSALTGIAGGANGVDFDDNVKARFGTGNDLEIYHDGSDSYIADAGTGDLIIKADDFRVKSADGSQNKLVALNAGGVTLLHGGTTKFATSTTGISVNGSVEFEGATADAYETVLNVEDPTADRTVLLPDASGTLGYVALSTVNITSNTTSLSFNNLPTEFDTFDIILHLHPSTDNDELRFQFLDSSGSPITLSSPYTYTYYRGNDTASPVQDPYHGHMKVGSNVGGGSHEGIRLVGRLVGRNYTDDSNQTPPMIFGHYNEMSNAGTSEGGYFLAGFDIYQTASSHSINGIKFYFGYGTGIAQGTGYLFGVKNA